MKHFPEKFFQLLPKKELSPKTYICLFALLSEKAYIQATHNSYQIRIPFLMYRYNFYELFIGLDPMRNAIANLNASHIWSNMGIENTENIRWRRIKKKLYCNKKIENQSEVNLQISGGQRNKRMAS